MKAERTEANKRGKKKDERKWKKKKKEETTNKEIKYETKHNYITSQS